ncbi:hypothetical protein [Streptomyces coffeae]|uniref:Uncharacterized protein n=1 Tax=Streptomyces coffeae TaxID=621382 RepID=A0ABS1NJA4_9ACTN|nr:hypothetical protein [Streptomyces coffeae]MBL1099997.1 hypothetical protein [Streptomyces coffeae]
MNDLDAAAVEELADTWDGIREDYDTVENDDYDRAALDCAARLAADPGGPSAYVWTLGLVMMAPYVGYLPGKGVATAVTDALAATDGALRDRPCEHASHPYQTHYDDNDEELAEELRLIADETADEEPSAPREEWRCPRNVAGFARIALDIVDAGSAEDIPPRLPMEARNAIETLSALLHGYPKPWTDINDEVESAGRGLRLADDPLDKAGHVMVVRAVTWYAVSGMIRAKSVLDDLVEVLEETLPEFDRAECGHETHPKLPDSGPDAAELGIVLSSPGGRRVFEYQWGNKGALEAMLCPAFIAGLAAESLKLLRERREELFGRPDTSRLDAEYLRPDGRLEIDKLVERIDNKPWNERYSLDLGLWAARRYTEVTDERERTVLLLTLGQTMQTAYPDPPVSVLREIVPVLRSAVAARPAEDCAHPAHPPLRRGGWLGGLPHLYAPGEHPAPGDALSPDAWTCPWLLAGYAEDRLSSLEGLLDGDG